MILPLKFPLLLLWLVGMLSCCGGSKVGGGGTPAAGGGGGRSGGTPCREPALSRCLCGPVDFLNKRQYLVNCTNTQFNSTKPLERLPPATQVLIFTGNNIPEVPVNVFGPPDGNSTNSPSLTELRVIDMSNNNIRLIHGKAFHRVSTVERLILNHNQLSTSQHHFRLFSNFENLLELHLTNAFADSSANLSLHLHSVFLESDLVKVRKLHLEQNEIRTLREEPLVFCPLNSLLDLHLGDNRLEELGFQVNCLKELRFIDLEGNSLTHLSRSELSALDALPARGQPLTLDLSGNPFTCQLSLIEDFFIWLRDTKVEVRGKEHLKCRHEPHLNSDEPLLLHAAAAAAVTSTRGGGSTGCGQLASGLPTSPPPQSSSGATTVLLACLLLLTTSLLVYTNRTLIRQKTQPWFQALSKKVQYTSIDKNQTEINEIEV